MFYVHICLCMLIVIVMFVLLPAWRINFFIRPHIPETKHWNSFKIVSASLFACWKICQWGWNSFSVLFQFYFTMYDWLYLTVIGPSRPHTPAHSMSIILNFELGICTCYARSTDLRYRSFALHDRPIVAQTNLHRRPTVGCQPCAVDG